MILILNLYEITAYKNLNPDQYLYQILLIGEKLFRNEE